VAVLIISHLRQSEWAGKSIPLRPFRWFVKVIACALVGIGSGYFVYLIYIGVWNKKLYPIMCAIMIVATIFAGCVMEVILEGNIRRFFKGMAQTIVAACLVLLTFIIYRGDLLGFDSYVPDPSKVASCAIIGGNRSFNSYTDTYYSYGTGSDMVLNNVEDVCKIARTGMKLQKELRDSDGRSSTGGYFMTVLYRMKNGRKIYRYIVVPYDSFDEEMERIVSSEEFKRGYFDIFSDDRVREADKATKSHTLRYVSMNSSSDTRNFDYEKVSDAYRKDLLENYTFSYIKESVPIGSIEYENNGTEDYIFGSLDVYDSFTNTIALLQEYGIYQEGTLKASDIKEIRVTNYFVGYDLEENSDADINYDSTKTSSVSYTDEESIEKIIEVSISNSYHNPWFNYDTTNEQFGIEVYLKGNSSSYCDQYYSFIRGKVPDFVKADTKG
jgi:ABC-2 type transport system permease protein